MVVIAASAKEELKLATGIRAIKERLKIGEMKIVVRWLLSTPRRLQFRTRRYQG